MKLRRLAAHLGGWTLGLLVASIATYAVVHERRPKAKAGDRFAMFNWRGAKVLASTSPRVAPGTSCTLYVTAGTNRIDMFVVSDVGLACGSTDGFEVRPDDVADCTITEREASSFLSRAYRWVRGHPYEFEYAMHCAEASFAIDAGTGHFDVVRDGTPGRIDVEFGSWPDIVDTRLYVSDDEPGALPFFHGEHPAERGFAPIVRPGRVVRTIGRAEPKLDDPCSVRVTVGRGTATCNIRVDCGGRQIFGKDEGRSDCIIEGGSPVSGTNDDDATRIELDLRAGRAVVREPGFEVDIALSPATEK